MKKMSCRPLTEAEKTELNKILAADPTNKSARILKLYSNEITKKTEIDESDLKNRIHERISRGEDDEAEGISNITIIKYLRLFNSEGLSCINYRSNTPKLTSDIKEYINQELLLGTSRKDIINKVQADFAVKISNVDITRSILSPVPYPVTAEEKKHMELPDSLLRVMVLIEILKKLSKRTKQDIPSLSAITAEYLQALNKLPGEPSKPNINFYPADEDSVREMLDSLVTLLSEENLSPGNTKPYGRLAKDVYSAISGHIVRYKLNDPRSRKPLLYYRFEKGLPQQASGDPFRRPLEERVLREYIRDLYDQKYRYYRALKIEYIKDYEWEKPQNTENEIELTKNRLRPVIRQIELIIPTKNYLVTFGTERYLVGAEVKKPAKGNSQSSVLSYYQLNRILGASIGSRINMISTKDAPENYRLWCTTNGVGILQNSFSAQRILAKKENTGEKDDHLFLIRFSKDFPEPRIQEIAALCLTYPNDIRPFKPDRLTDFVRHELKEALKKLEKVNK